jgi:hypothetical protein
MSNEIPLDSSRKTYEINHVYRYPFNWVIGTMWKRVSSDSLCNLKSVNIVKNPLDPNIYDVTREIEVKIDLPYFLQFFFPPTIIAKVEEKTNLDLNLMKSTSTSKILKCNVDYSKYIEFETETIIQYIAKSTSVDVSKSSSLDTSKNVKPGLDALLEKLAGQKKEYGLSVLNRRSTFSTLNSSQTFLPQKGKTLYNQKLHIVNHGVPTALLDFGINIWKKRFTPMVITEHHVLPIS